MNVNDRQIAPKEYSYLIYIAACLGMPLAGTVLVLKSNRHVLFEFEGFMFFLTMVFVFCSLAWMIGRKYDLNYPFRCAIGGAAFILPSLIHRIGIAPTSESLIIAVVFTILSALLIGTLLLAVSYPFQRLFFKFRS